MARRNADSADDPLGLNSVRKGKLAAFNIGVYLWLVSFVEVRLFYDRE